MSKEKEPKPVVPQEGQGLMQEVAIGETLADKVLKENTVKK